MQDRYVADVGDYGKYGLLRALLRTDLSLGVIWYRTRPELHTNDGAIRSYLKKPAHFEDCDAPLFRRLCELESRRQTGVQLTTKDVESLLPSGTLFFSSILGPMRRRRRNHVGSQAQHRRLWHARAQSAVRDQQVVFLDPDNGLGPTHLDHRKAWKYALGEEISTYLARGQSVILYHHAGRQQPVSQAVPTILRRLAVPDSFAMVFRRGTVRFFLILPTPKLALTLGRRANEMLEGPWRRHFERCS